jgi:hypothetical protein
MRRAHTHIGVLTLLLITATGTALAHHAAAQYEPVKTVTVKGKVKEFAWRNPHVMILVTTEAHENEPAGEWRFELSSPGNLTRSGWTKRSLNPGDIVTIECRPMRDGSHAGWLTKATLADGTVLRFGFADLEKSDLP